MTDDIWITDHALRRFLERVRGVELRGRCDRSALRQAVRAGVDLAAERMRIREIVTLAVDAGATRYKVRGVAYVFEQRKVVTVTPYRR
jgi:hypothetical protein